MTSEGLIQGRITDDAVESMRKRIGYPNPTVRHGYLKDPYNLTASREAIRRFAIGNGDDNPLFVDPDYATKTRWGDVIAPIGFEWSMGIKRHPKLPQEVEVASRGA